VTNFLGNIRIVFVLLFISVYLIPFYTEKTFAKTMSEVKCNSTEEKLVYDCMIYLTDAKTKEKISGAKFVVSADMPSMPGAHNIKPVIAHSMGLGSYHVRLKLDMYGEWVLKMDFTKPRRDRIVRKMTFGRKHNEMTHKQIKKHDHKKEELECHHNHAKKHNHEKGEMPMKHDE
jgi:hypothetical protein